MQNWRTLLAIQVGGIICLPTLIVGYILGSKLGLVPAVISILLGNVLLLVLGFGVLQLTKRYREDTPTLSKRFLGKKASACFYFVLGVESLGWFAIQSSFMAICFNRLIPFVSPFQSLLVVGIGVVALGITGLRGMAHLAKWSMPLMIVVLIGAVWMARGGGSRPIFAEGLDLTLVIGSSIGAILHLPTFFEKSRSSGDQKIAFVLAYGLALPIVELIGIYLGLKSTGDDMVQSLAQLGGPIWEIAFLLFLLLAGWTTNNVNLYSAAASARGLIPNTAARIGVVGTIGVALSLLPLLENLALVFNLMGVAVSSFCGLMVVGHLLLGGQKHPVAYAILWGVGTFVGLLTSIGVYEVTGVPLLDGFLFTTLLTAIYGWLKRSPIDAAAN